MRALVLVLTLALSGAALAQSKNLAPGFAALPKGAKVAIMPIDIELFSISAGGVLEPRADWTEAAAAHFKAALVKKSEVLALDTVEVTEAQADEFADVSALHAAVARSIALHHLGSLKLPTKEGKLDWTLGEAARAIKKATGADYALFSSVRDSYTSAERVATMIVLAAVGAVSLGGRQTGYASLVELETGRVVWFNRLARVSGELREAESATETLEALLSEFPVAK